MSTTPLTDAYIEKLEKRDNPKPVQPVVATYDKRATVLEVLHNMQKTALTHPEQARNIAVVALLIYIGDQEIIDAFNAIGN